MQLNIFYIGPLNYSMDKQKVPADKSYLWPWVHRY